MPYQKITELIKEKKEISFFVGICLLSLIGLLVSGSQGKTPSESAPQESFDTYIPEGFSLVPIEVANYETLDSLLGPYGVVDIFTLPQNAEDKAQRIAYRVKILRAPRNPSHFAVLIPFEKVKNLLRHPGPFMVSVQNPKSSGTGFEKEARHVRSRILYNLGD